MPTNNPQQGQQSMAPAAAPKPAGDQAATPAHPNVSTRDILRVAEEQGLKEYTGPRKVDGTPDGRYKENETPGTAVFEQRHRNPHPNAPSPIRQRRDRPVGGPNDVVNRDGTLDMRFLENRIKAGLIENPGAARAWSDQNEQHIPSNRRMGQGWQDYAKEQEEDGVATEAEQVENQILEEAERIKAERANRSASNRPPTMQAQDRIPQNEIDVEAERIFKENQAKLEKE